MITVRLCLASGVAAALFVTGTPICSADAAPQTLEQGTLKVCLYPGFAPFSSKDSDGRFIGWDVDYLEAFAGSHRLAFQPVEVPEYQGIWNQPAGGVCDIAASGISDTPDRRAATGPSVRWSQPYHHVLRAFLVRVDDEHDLNSIEDLRARTVIVTADSTADHDLRNRLARAGITDTTIVSTTDEEDAARQVLAGSASGEPFAYGGGLGSVQFLASKFPGLAVAWPHPNMLSDGSEAQEAFSYVVRALDVGLIEALDRFIADRPYPG